MVFAILLKLKFILSRPLAPLILALSAVSIICGCNANKPVQKTESAQSKEERSEAKPTRTPEEQARENMLLLRRSVDVNNKEGLDALKAGKLDRAEQLFLASLRQVDNLPDQEARRAMILNNLASVYEEKEMYAQAVPLLAKSQKLFIRAYGRKHPTVSITLGNLGRILSKEYRYEEAAPVYKTAISLMEESGNTNGDDYKDCLNSLLVALRKTGKGLQANELEKKIQALPK